jgi:hypothetical protein
VTQIGSLFLKCVVSKVEIVLDDVLVFSSNQEDTFILVWVLDRMAAEGSISLHMHVCDCFMPDNIHAITNTDNTHITF